MTISPEVDPADINLTIESVALGSDDNSSVVECPICGSRLQRNDEPDTLEVGSDSLRTIARHRCIPDVGPPG